MRHSAAVMFRKGVSPFLCTSNDGRGDFQRNVGKKWHVLAKSLQYTTVDIDILRLYA